MRDVDLRRALAPALGSDDDHAVGRLRAVDGGSRGALENLDVRDVSRIQINHPVDRRVLRRRSVRSRPRPCDGVLIGRNRHVGDDDAIHHVQRRSRGTDGGHPTKPHLCTTPWSAGVSLNVGTRHLALEGVLDTLSRDAVEFLPGHRGNGVGQVAPLDARAAPGYDDLLEPEDVCLQRDIHGALAS